MLSLLLITALAVQYPAPASKPAQDTTAPKRSTTAAPRGTSQSAVGRAAFHDRMRDLWSDHIVYTRNFIVSASATLPDTAEALQRLLRNQDEIGEAIKPYYGEAAGSQLTSLLRSHIQLAGKALGAAKGNTPMQTGMNMRDSSTMYISSRMSSDTVTVLRTDTTTLKISSQNPSAAARMGDTAKAKQPNVPQGQMQTEVQSQTQVSQTATVDSAQLDQAIAALRANGDSVAAFLNTANPRGFAREPMRTAIQMHIDLLLKSAVAHVKKDWSGSIAAFDESQRHAAQLADMLSEGIMKQFPSRFTNKATTVSSR